MKRILTAALIAAATPASISAVWAQAPAAPAAAPARGAVPDVPHNWATIVMTANVNHNADDAWKRIGGDPHTVNLNAYTSADGSKIMGTWICTPGKFEVNYEKWEYCHFLDGYCIITPEGEQPVHLKAGDVFVIEPGLKGTWEVVETVRKYFVFA